MKKYDVLMTKKARHDLIDINDYAHNLVKELKDKVLSLEMMPYRGANISDTELSIHKVKYLYYKNHYIFYWISEHENKVVVLRIGHNRRNWQEILKNISD